MRKGEKKDKHLKLLTMTRTIFFIKIIKKTNYKNIVNKMDKDNLMSWPLP